MARRPEMPSRKTISIPDELWEAVREYRYSRRIPTESEAFRRLLERGLEAEAKGKPPPRRKR